MKKIVLGFLFRGFAACGLGPLVLAMVYLILQHQIAIENLTVNEVCLGIFSLSALAFIAGGMNVIYQIERLPLMVAVLIHGSVLYIGYLCTYLINNWLEWDVAAIVIFSVIFIFVYMAIWAVIYSVIKKRTERVNLVLKKKQKAIVDDIE